RENDDGCSHIAQGGPFYEDASYAISHQGKGQFFNDVNCPLGEIMVTEKHPGQYHHWHYHQVYQAIAHARICCAGRGEDGDACEGYIPCYEYQQKRHDAAADGDVEVEIAKHDQYHRLQQAESQPGYKLSGHKCTLAHRGG